jgi:hypothetical protein
VSGPTWHVVAEAREIGGQMRWVERDGTPVPLSSIPRGGWRTAQRRNRETGLMELLVWFSAHAAVTGEPPRDAKPHWRKAEIEALVQAWQRGGMNAAYAALPGRTRRAIEAKAVALGLPAQPTRRRA